MRKCRCREHTWMARPRRIGSIHWCGVDWSGGSSDWLQFADVLLEKFLEAPNEADQRHAENSADLPEFEQVQTARSRFIVTDECLRFAQGLRHIDLSKASFYS